VNFYNKDQYYNDTIKPRTFYKTIVFLLVQKSNYYKMKKNYIETS
jgi:hypothetical protein